MPTAPRILGVSHGCSAFSESRGINGYAVPDGAAVQAPGVSCTLGPMLGRLDAVFILYG